MSIYSPATSSDDLEGLDYGQIMEFFLVDDLMHNYPEATVQEFCKPGGVGDALCEATLPGGLKQLGKRSVVVMSKKQDQARRTTLICFLLARKKGDLDYVKLVKFNALKKQYKAKIINKYSMKASRIAMLMQKEYVKNMRKVPQSFKDTGGSERVGNND